MGWTSAEGVAAVVQGAVCVSSFLSLFLCLLIFQVRPVGVCVGWGV